MTQRIPLTVGRARTHSGLFAVVDDEDYDRVKDMRWRVFLSGWGRVTAVSGDCTFLYRYLLNAPEGMEVVHLNGDGLDCRRENLRLGTHSQNLSRQSPRLVYAKRPASSQFKGVSYVEGRPRPWRATISVNRRQQFLGYHLTEEEAARAYDAAARLHFGEFARTNFNAVVEKLANGR